MAPLRSSFRPCIALGLALLALTVLAACGSGSDNGGEPAANQPEATAEGPARTPDEPLGPTPETGSAPISWRTEDQFQSLRAGEPYKVLFRVTSGYDEETLRIVAECLSCRGAAQPEAMEFEASRAEPAGPEDAGSFYPFNLTLPQPGTWQVTVVAGGDEATITVQVGPSG